jgi:hypothetical protein
MLLISIPIQLRRTRHPYSRGHARLHRWPNRLSRIPRGGRGRTPLGEDVVARARCGDRGAPLFCTTRNGLVHTCIPSFPIGVAMATNIRIGSRQQVHTADTVAGAGRTDWLSRSVFAGFAVFAGCGWSFFFPFLRGVDSSHSSSTLFASPASHPIPGGQ